MRTLKFIVDGERLELDPSCDFSGLFPGRNPEIQAEFIFSKDWQPRVKVAAFHSMLDKEYEPQILGEDNTCTIPKDALAKPAFKIQIMGKHRGRIFKTNSVTVFQRGGNK